MIVYYALVCKFAMVGKIEHAEMIDSFDKSVVLIPLDVQLFVLCWWEDVLVTVIAFGNVIAIFEMVQLFEMVGKFEMLVGRFQMIQLMEMYGLFEFEMVRQLVLIELSAMAIQMTEVVVGEFEMIRLC